MVRLLAFDTLEQSRGGQGGVSLIPHHHRSQAWKDPTPLHEGNVRETKAGFQFFLGSPALWIFPVPTFNSINYRGKKIFRD